MERNIFSGRKRKLVRLVSFLLAAFALMGGLAVRGYSEAARYR